MTTTSSVPAVPRFINDRIQEEFERFHANNPSVYRSLVKMARRAKDSGHERFGMKTLFEVLRWTRMTRRKDGQLFLLNNNFTSRYARLIEEQEADLKGFFELRTLLSEAA
jgi:hypothetical protein